MSVRHVVVCGLMGAGKSTVGAGLGRLLGWPVRDSDRDIERRAGQTVREIARRSGIERVHALEASHLATSLAERRSTIICAAASVVDDDRCRALLGGHGALLIWLRASAETLLARASDESHRPVLGPDRGRVVRDQIERRYPLYAALGPLVIDVDDQTIDEVIAAAAARIRTAWPDVPIGA